MASNHYDVIVAGVGGMGSSAAYHLARRGSRVLALERFDIPHELGSSHGITRIIRLAYYEHPSYVPLLRRAYELWRQTQAEFGEELLVATGSIDAAPEGSGVFEGSLASCREHGLPYEVLAGDEVNRRFPGYQLPASHRALLQPDGGFLKPERCIIAHVSLAQAHGAEVRAREPVLDWEPAGDEVRVRTPRGEYTADRFVVSAGAWVGKLVPALASLAQPERQVLAWFQPTDAKLYGPSSFPVFNLAVEEGRFYGLPIYGIPGFKVGRYHHLNERVDPETIDRQPDFRDEKLLRGFVERYFPKAAGPVMSLRVCMFTNTPDEHFILDTLPGLPQVVVASPCSGHGFKFCSVIGEIVAELTETGTTRHDISLHRLSRFAARGLEGEMDDA